MITIINAQGTYPPLYLRMKIATGLGFTAAAGTDGLVEIISEVTFTEGYLTRGAPPLPTMINLILPMVLHVDANTLAKTLTPWFLGNSGAIPYANSGSAGSQINTDFIVGYETADTDTVTLYLAQR